VLFPLNVTNHTGEYDSVLNLQPTDLYQRVPIFVGNDNLENKVKEYLAN
jgi:fructose-1,6-bisphosphatase